MFASYVISATVNRFKIFFYLVLLHRLPTFIGNMRCATWIMHQLLAFNETKYSIKNFKDKFSTAEGLQPQNIILK